MIVVSAILLLLYFAFYLAVFSKILKGDFFYLLVYVVICFPIYTLLMAIVYDGFEIPLFVKIIQYSKELLIFSALGLWMFGQKQLGQRTWRISKLDYVFIAFLLLAAYFLLIGKGEATRVNQAIYFKNILLIVVFYFFGRNIFIPINRWKQLFKIIFTMTILACVLVSLEKLSGVHFHSVIGYVKYNQHIKDIDPAGAFGLTYTFEAQGDKPRYAAFFANPLEFSASMLVSVSLGVIYLLSVPFKNNKSKYLLYTAAAFICVLFAYSRATFVAFFLMLVFISFLLKYYKLLGAVAALGVIMALTILLFASQELKYFIIDTLTFENSSSVTHIVDWTNAITSIISNPEGIGLAMSGNAGGVERDLIVGGENQYLIYGVQLGIIGMVLYIMMLVIGIRHAWKAFRKAKSREASIIPFLAATVKFGLLLPFFTSNGEAYIYLALLSWWLVGSAESAYLKSLTQRGVQIKDSKDSLFSPTT